MENALQTFLTKIDTIAGKTHQEISEFIVHVEAEIKKLPQFHIDIPVKHYFSKGVYAREITIPKGAIVIGRIHKFDNFNICSSGDISVLSIDGALRVKPPFSLVSKAGVKRLAYAHEDTVWTTVVATNDTDPEKIEQEFTADSFEDLNKLNGYEIVNVGGNLCLT